MLPILVMLVALPFAKPEGTQFLFAQALAEGFGVVPIGLVVLFVLFSIVNPNAWNRRHGAVLAETITLWLAAGVTVAHTI